MFIYRFPTTFPTAITSHPSNRLFSALQPKQFCYDVNPQLTPPPSPRGFPSHQEKATVLAPYASTLLPWSLSPTILSCLPAPPAPQKSSSHSGHPPRTSACPSPSSSYLAPSTFLWHFPWIFAQVCPAYWGLSLPFHLKLCPVLAFLALFFCMTLSTTWCIFISVQSSGPNIMELDDSVIFMKAKSWVCLLHCQLSSAENHA